MTLLLAGTISVAARTGDAGSTSGGFLRYGTGARAPAMGDAWTSGADGVMALHYNPAGLGFIERGEIEGMYQKQVLSSGQGSLGFAHPLGRSGGWGIFASYVDYGSTNRTTVSTVGGATVATGAGTYSGHDLAVGVSYGQHIADWSFGATAKAISSKIDDAGATGFAMDLGIQWRASRLPLEVGLTLQNLGTSLKYDVTSEELPLLARLGVSYSFMKNRLRLNADLEQARREGVRFLTGAEWWVVRPLALRVGYDGRNDLGGGLTVGAGFRWEDLAVDYAFIPFGKVGNNHRMALNYQFGAKRSERSRMETPAPATTAAPQPAPAAPASTAVDDYMCLGKKYAAEENWRQAISFFDLACRADSANQRAFFNAGAARYRLREYEGALENFSAVVNLTPRDAEAWLYCGQCQYQLGRAAEAAAAWRRVLELDPTNAPARKNLEALKAPTRP